MLVHGGSAILPELGEKLGKYAEVQMRKSGVEVRLNTHVKANSEARVECDDGSSIAAVTLVWTTGVTPSAILRGMKLRTEKGRIIVVETLESVDVSGPAGA